MNKAMFLAWGSLNDSKERNASEKAVTTSDVSGPKIPAHDYKEAMFHVSVDTWNSTTELFVSLEQTQDHQNWTPLVAGTALSAVSSELQSENKKFVQKLLKSDASDFSVDFGSFSCQAIRLVIRGDVAGATVRATGTLSA